MISYCVHLSIICETQPPTHLDLCCTNNVLPEMPYCFPHFEIHFLDGKYEYLFSHFFLNAHVPIFLESFCNKIGPETLKTLKSACLETARVSV